MMGEEEFISLSFIVYFNIRPINHGRQVDVGGWKKYMEILLINFLIN